MSTKAQLRTAIKREARINSSTNLDSMVDDIVADIMRDFCNKTRYYELLATDTVITAIAATGTYSLPVGFQNLSEIRYATATTGQIASSLHYRTLIQKTDVVKRFSVVGYPMFYRLASAGKINIFPNSLIAATDSILIDYYIDPATLYTTDASEFPIPRLEGAVKKAAIARVQRFSGAIAETQLTDKDADASYVASEGGH